MKHLDYTQIQQIVDAMHAADYAKDSVVIRERDVGTHVFVIEGTHRRLRNSFVTSKGKKLCQWRSQECELGASPPLPPSSPPAYQ